MKKFFFYPSWRYEKAEAFLFGMEEKGWRLEKVRCGFWFRFCQSAPRRARYVFLYHFVKDREARDYDAEQYLLGQAPARDMDRYILLTVAVIALAFFVYDGIGLIVVS